MERWVASHVGNGLEVSSVGRVRRAGRVLYQRKTSKGYLRVRVRVDGVVKQLRVHVLVLIAFKGPPAFGQESRHLDGVRSNNSVENLGWGTAAENVADRRRYGTLPAVSVAKSRAERREQRAGRSLLREERIRRHRVGRQITAPSVRRAQYRCAKRLAGLSLVSLRTALLFVEGAPVGCESRAKLYTAFEALSEADREGVVL
jgi:hypothetical protein